MEVNIVIPIFLMENDILIEDSSVDLFFAPGKHEGWVNLFNLSEGPCLGRVYSSKEVAESMIGKCGLHPYIATVKIEWEE